MNPLSKACVNSSRRQLLKRGTSAFVLAPMAFTQLGCTTQSMASITTGTKRGFEYDTRNVSQSDALQIVEHQGRLSAKITLSKSMAGHPDDWNRVEMQAQRFEYAEPRPGTRVGNEVWYLLSFWLPNNLQVDETSHLCDFKEFRGGQTYGPLVSFSLKNDGIGPSLKLTHKFADYNCVVGEDINGTSNSYCNWTDTNVDFGALSKFQNRWVTVVFRAKWDPVYGEFDTWIDGQKVIGYRGNTSYSADAVRFKYGLYRIKLNNSRVNTQTVYFSNAAIGSSCNNIGLPSCDEYISTIGTEGYQNTRRLFTYRSNEMSRFLRRGGVVTAE